MKQAMEFKIGILIFLLMITKSFGQPEPTLRNETYLRVSFFSSGDKVTGVVEKSYPILEGICQKAGITINVGRIDYELKKCKASGDIFDHVKWETISIGEEINNSYNYDTNSIDKYSQSYLQLATKTIPQFCKRFKSVLECAHPRSLKALKPCIQRLNDKDRYEIGIEYDISGLFLNLICRDNAERVFELVNSGFLGCWDQYAKKVETCIEKLYSGLGLGRKENCKQLQPLKDCLIDPGTQNELCSNEAIDSFHDLTREIKEWFDMECPDNYNQQNSVPSASVQIPQLKFISGLVFLIIPFLI